MIAHHCTEVRFASLHSGGFTTMAVINPPERKLAKRTSVRCIDSGLSQLVYVYGFCCGLLRAYFSVLGLEAQRTYTLVHILLPFVQEPLN